MRLFNGCHSSTHQTLKHNADSSDVIISSGSAGNREISSYRIGIEATHTSEFAAQHSLSPPAPYTSALAALYSNPTTPALTPMNHSVTLAMRDCSAALFNHPHNTAAHPERWKAKTEATFRVEFRDDCKNTDAAYGFSTYSPHPILYHEKMYPTSEHLLQALQFERNAPDLAEHIRTCSDDPEKAVAESGRHHKFRCFPKVDALDTVLLVKFLQHSDLRKRLLDTGDAELVYKSATYHPKLGDALKRLRRSFLAANEARLSSEVYQSQAIEIVTSCCESAGSWYNEGDLINAIFT